MATNFPSSLDSLTNPTSTDALNSPSHADQHADANDAIEALEAKVGVDGSAVTSSLDFKVTASKTVTDKIDPAGASADQVLKFDGTKFVPATGSSLTASDTPPGSPVAGELWYESDTGRQFIYYDSVWVEIGNATDIAGVIQPKQITDLTAVTSLTSDDVFAVVDNPSSAVAANKITVENLAPALMQSAPQTTFRNAIINGDFRINQRVWSSSTASGTYGFDRWKQVNSGGTVTMSSQSFTVGSPAATGYEAEKFCRVVTASQSALGDYALLVQQIEDVRSFANLTITVSFWAKASSGTPKVALEMQQVFGSGGSADVNTYGGQATLSTSWARYSLTVNVPSISGKTIGTSSNLGLQLWISGGATFNSRTGSLGIQNNTFDFWGVQVERGSYATPFEQRPIQKELSMCQRYYEKSYALATAPGTATSTGAVSVIPYTTTAGKVVSTVRYAVPKRIAPTVTIYSTADGSSGFWFEAGFGNRSGASQYGTEFSTVLYNTVVAAAAGAEYTTQWVASIEF